MTRNVLINSLLILTLMHSGVCQEAERPERPSSTVERSPTDLGREREMRSPRLSEPAENMGFTISKQVDEVNLFLSVTDSKGRFISDLTANDLQLLDDHKPPAKWSYFQARTNLPLRVILAVDVSTSIRERLHFEQQAASAFLKLILRKETDEAAVVAFGSKVQEKTTGMTSDAGTLEASIRTLQANGETAMYDAIIHSCHKLRESKSSSVVRPVIILITDGVDTASKETLKAAEDAALRSEAAIFALDASSIYETDRKGRLVLEQLTRETGGFVLPARENADLKGAFNQIAKILRNQYALGYPPPELEANGKFRRIEVTSNRHGLQVHARFGYFAPQK